MNEGKESLQSFRPADVCRALLAALEGAEGRRKKRKRDQTPDGIKREILERVVQDDPDSDMFEGWLLNYSQKSESNHSSGAVSAMARAVLDEWRLAHSMRDFKAWLDRGAPSDDADACPATPRQ